MTSVANADVDGSRWVSGTRRQLEGGRPSGFTGKDQQAFLHREMAGICRAAERIERSRKGDGQRLPKRDTDGDPGFERNALTATKLDATDPGLVNAGALGQLSLCQPKSEAAGSDRRTKCARDRPAQTIRFADRVGRSPPGRYRRSHSRESYIWHFTGHYRPILGLATLGVRCVLAVIGLRSQQVRLWGIFGRRTRRGRACGGPAPVARPPRGADHDPRSEIGRADPCGPALRVCEIRGG